MKRKRNSFAWLGLICLITLQSGCTGKQEHTTHEHHADAAANYICPMRCEGDKTYTRRGNCPVCKMKLEAAEEKLLQTESPARLVLSRQSTTKMHSAGNATGIQAEGVIVPATDRMQAVSARFGGRIEKLYVKAGRQYVGQGEKIMEIYSPDMRTYQEQHLFLLKSAADPSMINRSREKMRLLGISEQQIARLEKNKRVEAHITVYNPAGGYVFFGTSVTPASDQPEKSDPMGSMGMQQESGLEKKYDIAAQVREGMYVSEGQTLFNVNPLDFVWAMISVPGRHLPQLRENQSVKIQSESNPELVLSGKVSLIEQRYDDANQRFVKVRVVLNNPDHSLKINDLITAYILSGSDETMQVPSSAVFRTGLSAYVWVKTGLTPAGTGIFKARKVIAEADHNGFTAIRSGLAPEEEIALQAGLLIDNETFINER